MIVYITRPENHEVVMGGWRNVILWTDEPHYHHWPMNGYRPMDTDSKATYYDRGWAYNGDRTANCRAKPLLKQNADLELNAWRLTLWSCIPKEANIALEDTFEWCDTLLPGEDPANEFRKTNIDMLLFHYRCYTDEQANVHFKRFLMEVNLITAECKLIVPQVHIYGKDPKTERTQNIEEPYASRINYECPEMDDGIFPF